MDRRRFVLAVGSGAAAFSGITRGQTKGSIPRIGLMWLGAGDSSALKDALLTGLKRRGYEAGRNIAIVDRTTVTQYQVLPQTAKELVEAKVDLIVAFGVAAPHAAQKATATIPIVMVGTDPDQRGLVKTLSRPGGNITGIATLTTELMAKRLELFRDCVAFRQFAALVNPEGEGGMSALPTIESEARRLKLQLKIVEAAKLEDFEPAMARAAQGNTKALFIMPSTMYYSNSRLIASLAIKHKLATMAPTAEFVEAGALIGYAPDYPQLFDRAAAYVVRILKGERPADMPMEQPSEFVLALNLKTAATLGVKVPEAMRFRATKLVQ